MVIVSLGWIIAIAAGDIRRELKIRIVLKKIKAEDIMTREYPVINQQMNVGQLVHDHVLKKGTSYIIVADGNKLKGILTLNQIESIPSKHWNNTPIGNIMTPTEKIRTAQLQQTANTLFEEMQLRNIDYIPVLEEENIVGVVNRDALLNLVETRIRFGA